MISTTPPEPGQLVEVRQRHYVVTEVAASALPPDPLGNGHGPQHLVSLSAVEDDALGEELRVVWELEPGARVHERALLPRPDAFDPPARLDAFLDAVRWGAIASADVRHVQAPFRSGIQIEDYQLDPVVRAVAMPRVSLLVADDVGLGKTIEAGLVALELILRHRARRILVVCPASLQIQWRDQMRDKFGLEFRIVDSALLHALRRARGIHANPWTHFPRLITSVDFLKRERPLRLFRDVLPAEGEPAYPRRFDLLIVDEAHNVAPAGSGRYATDSQRTRAVRALVPHFEHKLFLSATPHNGYPESFSALLELLDNQRFARTVRPDPRQLATVMVRRLKSDPEIARDWAGRLRFPPRVLEPLEVAYTDAERRIHAALQRYSTLRQADADDPSERYASEFVLKLLKKRLFSSPEAFAVTLARHRESLAGARRRPAAARPTLGILRRQLEEVEEDYAEDAAYEESTAEAVELATRLFRPPSREEQALLDEMQAWARTAVARPDSKARRLIRWLHETLQPGGRWNDERVIVFTEYRATQRWLQGLLAGERLSGGDRLLTLYGGMDAQERERIKAAFQASPTEAPVRILLATDAASEGIDLQNYCARLIHYEIPWNPNRLEQRNGRIDRHGQRAERVLVYHFVGQGYREHLRGEAVAPDQLESDLEFLARAAEKVEQIREDLGKVGPVIAAQVEEAMLGRRARLDTAAAERAAAPARQMLRFERQLRQRIAELRDRLADTRRELRLAPENVQAVVEVGLELAGQPPLREARVAGLWPDPTGRRHACPVFHLPALKGSWAPCAEGLADPYSGAVRPIVFDHALAEGRDDVVLVHLNHRLVQMCLRLLRAEVWAPTGPRRLARVTARLVPDAALDTPAVVAHARLVVLGGDGQRLHEEIVEAGGTLRGGRFDRRLNEGQLAAALGAALDEEAPAAVQASLAALWPRVEGPLQTALEARLRERARSQERQLAERADREAAEDADFAILQSNFHEPWARAYSSQLETRLNYSPTDCFDTFPFPDASARERDQLSRLGAEYHTHRAETTRRRSLGLTKVYNLFHQPDCRDADIARLRELHVEMDRAVAAAYGWTDLDLGHGFHETKQGVRFTISEAARREVLDRLLRLNHERYAEEVRQGLHEPKNAKAGRRRGAAGAQLALPTGG